MKEMITEIIRDILIGLFSGVVSSLIVTIFWQKRIDRIEEKKAYEINESKYKSEYYNTIQIYTNYLNSVRLELDLDSSDIIEKNNSIRRIVDSRPYTPGFTNSMTEDGINKLIELSKLTDQITDDIINNVLSDSKCKKYRSMIFIIECDLLKNQNNYLKPYNENKNDSSRCNYHSK